MPGRHQAPHGMGQVGDAHLPPDSLLVKLLGFDFTPWEEVSEAANKSGLAQGADLAGRREPGVFQCSDGLEIVREAEQPLANLEFVQRWGIAGQACLESRDALGIVKIDRKKV